VASDGALSATATVAITVTAVNDAPVAGDDAYTTTEDVVLTVAAPGVLGNDSDADGDPLTAVLAVPPAHGALTLDAAGAFVYTPTLNWSGADAFTYVASDGVLTATATVGITVTAVNDAPVAADDAYTTTEDVVLTVAAPGVLGNDSDVDGDPLTAVLAAPPAHGAVALDAAGAFVYTPTLNWSGVVTFTYRANDGLADSNPATVTITVTPAPGWKVYLPLVGNGYTP
jgi:VCBS repeat-containing protein